MLFFLVTACLIVAVQSCMELNGNLNEETTNHAYVIIVEVARGFFTQQSLLAIFSFFKEV